MIISSPGTSLILPGVTLVSRGERCCLRLSWSLRRMSWPLSLSLPWTLEECLCLCLFLYFRLCLCLGHCLFLHLCLWFCLCLYQRLLPNTFLRILSDPNKVIFWHICISGSPGITLRYSTQWGVTAPSPPITMGITVHFAPHILCSSSFSPAF